MRSPRGRYLTLPPLLLVVGLVATGCGDRREVGWTGTVANTYEIRGVLSRVQLPTGRLDLVVTPVLDRVPGTDDGPGVDGGGYVAVRWSVDSRSGSSGTRRAAAESDPPELTLVADGDRTPLELPVETDGPTPGGVVVAVPDDADLSVEVAFDGVVQTVDPVTGEVHHGDAGGLYDGSTRSWPAPACPGLEVQPPFRAGDDETVSCEIGTVVQTPFTTETGWAEPGTSWWVVPVSSSGQTFDLRLGGDVGNLGAVTDVSATLDGEASRTEAGFYAPEDDAEVAADGGTGDSFVFPAPASGSGALRLEVTYSGGGQVGPPVAVLDVALARPPAPADLQQDGEGS